MVLWGQGGPADTHSSRQPVAPAAMRSHRGRTDKHLCKRREKVLLSLRGWRLRCGEFTPAGGLPALQKGWLNAGGGVGSSWQGSGPQRGVKDSSPALCGMGSVSHGCEERRREKSGCILAGLLGIRGQGLFTQHCSGHYLGLLIARPGTPQVGSGPGVWEAKEEPHLPGPAAGCQVSSPAHCPGRRGSQPHTTTHRHQAC